MQVVPLHFVRGGAAEGGVRARRGQVRQQRHPLPRRRGVHSSRRLPVAQRRAPAHRRAADRRHGQVEGAVSVSTSLMTPRAAFVLLLFCTLDQVGSIISSYYRRNACTVFVFFSLCVMSGRELYGSVELYEYIATFNALIHLKT